VPLVAGLFDEPIDMWNGTLQAARTVQFLLPEPGRKPYVIESAPGHPGLLAFALPWEGTDQHEALMDRARFIGPLIAVTEDGGEGRVSMTRSGRTRVDYRLDGIGVATLRHALGSMARLARAAGARQIVAVGTPARWFGRGGSSAGNSDRAFVVYEDALRAFDFAPNRGAVFSAHQMGTARMGADAAAHACDPGGRVRLGPRGDTVLGGLYVADSSLFPTGVGVNPMLTVMAMARRVGRTVLAEG
jgi:choline dehydrogenase-like flavoprotein